MTNNLREKVMYYGSVDTKKYRYIVKPCENAKKQWLEIRRISLDTLGTTVAINGWELVEVIK